MTGPGAGVGLAATGAVFLAALVKGAIGVGFPTVATPLLALLLDVRTAVVLLLLPNIVMDGILVLRRREGAGPLRRLVPYFASGVIGTVLGTRLLFGLPQAHLFLLLAGMIVAALVSQIVRPAAALSAAQERLLVLPAGLLTGFLGGLTNVAGPPVVIFFHLLRFEKRTFVRSVAATFIVLKVTQLLAVAQWAPLSQSLGPPALLSTAVALLGFAVGLRIQDRFRQETFTRAIQVFLAVSATALLFRGLRGMGLLPG